MVKPLLKKYVGSLWRREKACVFVAPGSIELLRGRGKTPATISVRLSEPAQWDSVCKGVADLVRDNLPAGSAVGLVLSNHWVRYLTLPAGRGRLGREVETELARSMLTEQFGAGWEDAIVCVEDGVADEGVLAAAIRRDLAESLRTALGTGSYEVQWIAPLFSHLFDQACSRMKGPSAMVACLEPGRVVLGMVGPDGWRWVRSPIAAENPVSTLERELARECALLASDATVPLYLLARGTAMPDRIDGVPGISLHSLH